MRARVRKLLVRAARAGPTRQYFPYVVPGLSGLLERIEPLRRRLHPVRCVRDLEAMLPTERTESHVPCPLCGADRVRLLHRPRKCATEGTPLWEYRAGRCPDCGLLQRVPAIKPECVPELYAGGGYSAFLEGKYLKGRVGKYRRTLSAFEPYFDQGDGRRLLDYGCGTGAFLGLALERGFDAWGVDLSPDAVELAAERFGAERVWCGEPGDAPQLAGGGFDVITLWSVLAHFADPVERLGAIRSLLAPGGVLLIYTVNAQSLELKAYGSRWSCFNKNHLLFWEPSTLTPLLRRVGFGAVAYRPFYGSAIEQGTGRLSQAQRARIITHIERYQSGGMMRALAINGPAGSIDLTGTFDL